MAKMANASFAKIFTTPVFGYADVTFTIHLLFNIYERLSVNIDPRSAQVQNLIPLIFGSSITLNE